MIKRDTIQRVVLNLTSDGMGGNTANKEYKERVPAHVSVGATQTQISQYGISQYGAKTALTLNVITNIKLDEYVHTRYEFSGKMYKLIHQIKSGNEWFAVLMEVNE